MAHESQQAFQGGIKTRMDTSSMGRACIRVWGGNTTLTIHVWDFDTHTWIGKHIPSYDFGLKLRQAYGLV